MISLAMEHNEQFDPEPKPLEVEPEPVDSQGETSSPLGPPGGGARTARVYRRRLSNLRNVRTGLADTIRALEAGELDAVKARTLVYGYSSLASVLVTTHQQDELTERVAKLEESLASRGSRKVAA